MKKNGTNIYDNAKKHGKMYASCLSPPSLRNSIRTLSSPGALHFFISVRAFLTSSLVMSGTCSSYMLISDFGIFFLLEYRY